VRCEHVEQLQLASFAPEALIDGSTSRLIRRRQSIEKLLALEDV
jgi:hypothetical protein